MLVWKTSDVKRGLEISMILCDTNILIEFYKGSKKIVQELRHIGQKQIGITAITQAELYFGALNKGELEKIKKHLLLLTIFPIDITISTVFIQIMENYALSHKLGIPDGLIASTAIVYELDFYTLNIRDFQFISSLKVYHPFTY